MTAPGRIRDVVVAGDGVVARLAAVAIARRIPDVRVVRVTATEADGPLEDMVGAARPSIRAFHHQLGVDETEILSRTGGCFRLGTLVEDWSGGDPDRYFRGHGEHGRPLGGTGFHHYWLRDRRGDADTRFEEFSPAAALALAGRFALPSADRDSAFAALDYGLQLDLPAYREALCGLGGAAGVVEMTGRIDRIEHREDGAAIAALHLADGRMVSGDLYIDATGTERLLRNTMPFVFEDWGGDLLVDRLLLAGEATDSEPPPYDRLVGMTNGWRIEARTAARATQLLAYSSRHLDDEQARRALRDSTGCEPQAAAFAIQQGRVTQPWSGNCVAIGAAAIAVEPSGATALHLLCRQLDRLIGSWPGRDCGAVESDFYNRRTALEAGRVRDFLRLPYLLSNRPEPFWRDAAHSPPSDELARDLALFRERGRLPLHDEDRFEQDEWLSVLIGHGLSPGRIDPLTDGIEPQAAAHLLSTMRADLMRAADRAPRHGEVLARLGGGR